MPTASRWFPAWRHAWVRALVYLVAAFVAYLVFVYTLQFLVGTHYARVWTAKILEYSFYALLIGLLIRALFFSKKVG